MLKKQMYIIRLDLELNPNGVYTVTSPDIPGLVTEGRNPEEISHNVQECLAGLFEVWADLGMELPPALRSVVADVSDSQFVDMLVAV